MLNITPICKRFNKLPAHFRDNFEDKSGFGYETVGRTQHTTIDDKLIPDFLLWLSNGAKGCKEIRQMLARQGIEKTLEFARRYKK